MCFSASVHIAVATEVEARPVHNLGTQATIQSGGIGKDRHNRHCLGKCMATQDNGMNGIFK